MKITKLKPIIFSNELLRVAPIQDRDFDRLELMAKNLFQIFRDEDTTRYNPEKKMISIDEARKLLADSAMSYSLNSRYNHFISLQNNQNVIGYISIVPPFMVEDDYRIKDTWFIEYFLYKELWNKGFMTNFLNEIVNGLKMQDITSIGALVNKNNISSIKVLEKCNFKKVKSLDNISDFYKLKMNWF